ncbi:zinc-binding alcohol dehydrogenase family protein [Aspergillus homomorphus CBS 101889]|uniref:Zinc-binding dehydrogenase family oxidoreductase n=1 Tax=Aspergillus homomorphus (strain CBS 101889) TaxID=1450537 RepID=A0A395IBS0_ASPHC|nr:zinc-binding dehydrogenase family oxidoreductase [Aspergillus homomorphus CBS 101889]RAL17652.1 zinc-binding dehydrogenase family oxidoreductase [Aspergillus homomorphus CBS 101889]
MSANQQMTAQVLRQDNAQGLHLSKEPIQISHPSEGQVLVKITHAAQNPTDVQSLDNKAFGEGAVLGCDFVGEVTEVGRFVQRYNKGDIIAGLIWGGEIKGLGAYSEYTLADGRISYPVSGQNISREQASTVPLAAATAWLALFSKDCLAIDHEHQKSTDVLIWGGSSSVGLYAIQLATMYGLQVTTTCSPRHADLVRSYGAQHVFDYKDDKVIEKIQAVASTLSYAFDTIGNATSSPTSSRTFYNGNGTLCTVRPGKTNTEDVTSGTRVTDVLVWTSFIKDHTYGEFKWPASKDDHALAAELFAKLSSWLEEGALKPSTPRILHGLDAVPQGFQEYRDGKISAYKIVYAL